MCVEDVTCPVVFKTVGFCFDGACVAAIALRHFVEYQHCWEQYEERMRLSMYPRTTLRSCSVTLAQRCEVCWQCRFALILRKLLGRHTVFRPYHAGDAKSLRSTECTTRFGRRVGFAEPSLELLTDSVEET